ncbi:MAG: phosphoribosylamine--glycine ligase [Candidatus Coatesbacteria bacterium]|nr:MAG: phosphoribosylamine--glycine ligase [Candidatus Coatesbacteria bacterium]
MRVMIVGGGGREHALAWKVTQSPLVDEVFCVPGNAGTAAIARNIPADAADIPGIVSLAQEHRIDLTIVGPEAPLAKGLSNALQSEGLAVFGPTKDAARIESSKVFAKNLMAEYAIPTASYWVFDDFRNAISFVDEKGLPVVIKADGLAAGKGAFVCRTDDDVDEALRKTLVEERLGDAGKRILVEECLVGQEASVVVITDGETVLPLPSSEDHKQLLDGDRGPNTGGMGAFSPTEAIDDALQERVVREIMLPAIRGLKEQGIDYRGALYAGLMIVDGDPYVLEFNCRFGDPETQATLPRVKGDLVPVLLAAADGSLKGMKIDLEDNHCVCVTLASKGYPGRYERGLEIQGLSECEHLDNVIVFHAGTKTTKGSVITAGGRVLGVTAIGATKKDALQRVYDAVDRIDFQGKYFRRDIGMRSSY